MSSYPPPSSKRNAFLISPGAGEGFSSNLHSKHTTIDPFGRLRSHQSSETSSDHQTPKTPIDPLYLHPNLSEADSFPAAAPLDKKVSPCTALQHKPCSSQSREHQHAINNMSTPIGIKTCDPLTIPAHAHTDAYVKPACDFLKPLGSVTSPGYHDSRKNTCAPTNAQDPTATEVTSNGEMNRSSGHDDRSSDANMVICEPGGFMWLLSRSFQFVVSVFHAPPLQMEIRVDKFDQERKDDDDDDLSDPDEDFSDDDDSQDSARHSQPSSPRTPRCYSGSSWAREVPTPTLTPFPPSSPAFCSPVRPMQGRPGQMPLPPNWLPWRPSYESVQDRQRRRHLPPPLLPTLSPSTPENDTDRRGNYFPVLPRRPLPLPQYRWAAVHAEWVVPPERPVAVAPDARNARPGPALKPPVPMQSMTTLGPSICCPISGGIMLEPVIDPDGFSYEKRAILEWLSSHTTSPFTHRPLAPHQLRPNRTLQCVIQSLLQNMNAN